MLVFLMILGIDDLLFPVVDLGWPAAVAAGIGACLERLDADSLQGVDEALARRPLFEIDGDQRFDDLGTSCA
jgi:hypothetical protein